MVVVPPHIHPDHLDPHGHEEADEDISGTQFVCETVIRSLTLEESDHKPQRRARQGIVKPAGKSSVLLMEGRSIFIIY